MVAHKSKKDPLTIKDVEELNELTDGEIRTLSDSDVHTLVDGVSEGTLKLQAYVKGLDKFFARLKELRLIDISQYPRFAGRVLEYPSFVLQVVKTKPSTPYKAILAALVKEHPELKDEVNTITESEKGKKEPGYRVYRHQKSNEPKTWKEIEHAKINPVKESKARKRLPHWILNLFVS